jgi:CubicO group peptidase (beta-lactamase class C family)
MRCLFSIVLVFAFSVLRAQYYFPPTALADTNWARVSPSALGWCESEIDSVLQFLDEKNTKAFIVLKDGKIAIEKYYGTFVRDSFWYWASAGKTLTAFLVGVAHQENILDIHDKTSDYLGTGWTVAPQPKEDLITIKHQLSMTTGLDYTAIDDNCIIDTCLKYKSDAGTEWYYYNAPYRLLQDVVAAASGVTFNQYTNSKMRSRTGLFGQWINYVFYSRARDMARFGLLMLNKGIWNNDTILKDAFYYNEMINTSQQMNLAYGYLWWLNGKASFKLPGLTATFSGELFPDAPDDMFSALGKNDQKIYVVPSMDLVIVRMGNSAGSPAAAASSFDNELWIKLNKVFCPITDVNNFSVVKEIYVYPNPASNQLNISGNNVRQYSITDIHGKLLKQQNNISDETSLAISIESFPIGIYLLHIFTETENKNYRFVKQ